MSETLVNKIANSGLITLKPEEWAPAIMPEVFDIKDFLFKGLILKEQEFRDQLKTYDWNQYSGKTLCIFCSADAIIPNWAYMLVVTYASPIVKEVFFGNPQDWTTRKIVEHIHNLDITPYTDQRVIIKGCSDGVEIGPEIYTSLAARLVPIVRSLMFGEPCSTVPVYKRIKST